jgi:hypothetical protein
LIVGAGDRAPAAAVWARFPPIRILTIAGGGRTAVLRILHAHEVVLDEVSLQGLLPVLRTPPAW